MEKWGFLVFLTVAVGQDLRSRSVGQGFLAAAGGIGAAISLLSGRSLSEVTASVSAGILLLILGWITGGGIGEGDGWFFTVTGLFLEPAENWILLLSGLIFCSVYSLAYVAASLIGGGCVRKKRLPFLPFLLPVGLWLALF